MKHVGLAFGLLAMLACGQATAKEYFKWTDDKGVTHFTTAPPKDRPSETVNTYAGSSTTYDPAAATAQSKEGQEEKSKLEKTKEDEAKAASQKEEKCKRVSDQIKVLKERDRVRMLDKEGNERVLSPEEQQAKTAELQKFFDENFAGVDISNSQQSAPSDNGK